MEREEALQKITQARDYFCAAADDFNDFERINAYQQYISRLRPENAPNPFFYATVGSLVAVIPCIMAAAIIVRILFLPYTLIAHRTAAAESVIVTILGICLVPVAVTFVYQMQKRSARKKSEDIQKAQAKAYQDLQYQYDLLVNYYEACPLGHVVPMDYCVPEVVATLAGYIENMRADSIKEAINLWEEEMHRTRMEQTQQQIVYNSQQAVANSAAAARNSAISAFASIVSAASRL